MAPSDPAAGPRARVRWGEPITGPAPARIATPARASCASPREDALGHLNRQLILASYPLGEPRESDFALRELPAPAPGSGEVLCRTLYLSMDPYMRVPLLPPASHVPRSAPGIAPGDLMIGGAVSEVLESRHADLGPGDIVEGRTGWQTHFVSDGSGLRRVDPALAPISTALGVLGMPGFTAWVGLHEIGRPQPGETVVVSAAAGAVGSLVGQLARLGGCRAVGIAGSAEKCEGARETLGLAACVSHRGPGLAARLGDACPAGIDVYFDNVGGDVLEAVVAHLNPFARVAVCGRISHLNETGPPGGRDRLGELLGEILTRRLTLRGFTQGDFAQRFDAFLARVAPLVRSGEVRFREEIVEGFEGAPAAFGRLFDGSASGKLLVHVADPGTAR